MFLALATYLDFEIHQVDIVAAYLQDDLDKEIYMTISDSISQYGLEGQYWWLYKALYSLKQAGQQWKKRLHEVFTKLGLTYTFTNNYLYIKKEKDKIILIILVYVNDMAVATSKSMHITSFKMVLHNDFDITNLRELKFMLGIHVTYNHTN